MMGKRLDRGKRGGVEFSATVQTYGYANGEKEGERATDCRTYYDYGDGRTGGARRFWGVGGGHEARSVGGNERGRRRRRRRRLELEKSRQRTKAAIDAFVRLTTLTVIILIITCLYLLVVPDSDETSVGDIDAQ